MPKIEALGIRKDFKSVYIDDPRDHPRFDKYNIFSKILSQVNRDPKDIWVIRANPDSEIIAAKNLGMRTIQRSAKSKDISKIADYQINTFNQLKGIIN